MFGLPFLPPNLPHQRRSGRAVGALAHYFAHAAEAEMVEQLGGAVIVGGGGFADQVEAERIEHPGEAVPGALGAAALALAVGVEGAAEFAGGPLGPEAQVAVAADPALLVKIEEQQAGAALALGLMVGDEGADRGDGQRAGQGIDRGVDARVAEKFVEGGGILRGGEAGRLAAAAERGGRGDGGADRGGLFRRRRGAGDRDGLLCRHRSGLAAFRSGCQSFSRGRSAPG